MPLASHVRSMNCQTNHKCAQLEGRAGRKAAAAVPCLEDTAAASAAPGGGEEVRLESREWRRRRSGRRRRRRRRSTPARRAFRAEKGRALACAASVHINAQPRARNRTETVTQHGVPGKRLFTLSTQMLSLLTYTYLWRHEFEQRSLNDIGVETPLSSQLTCTCT